MKMTEEQRRKYWNGELNRLHSAYIDWKGRRYGDSFSTYVERYIEECREMNVAPGTPRPGAQGQPS